MRTKIITVALLCLATAGYSQLDGSAFMIGLQHGKSFNAGNTYPTTSMDFRYSGALKDVYMGIDGSSLFDLLDYIVRKSFFGKDLSYRKLSDWTFIQTAIAFGASGIFVGPDFELASYYVSRDKTYWGYGGGLFINRSKLKASLRVNKLGTEIKQSGFAIISEIDLCLGNYFYVGAFHKFRRFKEFQRDDGDAVVDGLKVNTLGIRAGFVLAR
jgi:hypothetical protein